MVGGRRYMEACSPPDLVACRSRAASEERLTLELSGAPRPRIGSPPLCQGCLVTSPSAISYPDGCASRPQRRPDRSRRVARCAPEGAERPSSVVELPTGLRSRPAIPLAHATALTMFMEPYPSMAGIRANDAPFCVASDMRHASAAAPTRGDAAVLKIDHLAPYRHVGVQLGT